ncbi:MAG: TPR end-of-group domain-containing protein [Myxococcaceae bacterium]
MHTCLAALMVVLPALAGATEGAPWAGGAYRSAELGLLEFKSEAGRVSGKYQGGGTCADFLIEQQIIEGQFEGNVMVGTVMLCQSGAACKQRSYPFLAFFNPLDGGLSAEIKLDAGCTSPALKGTRLLLTAASEDKVPGKPVNGSAALVAKKKGNPKRNAELAGAAAVQGGKLIETGDYAGAAQQFEIAISYNDKNWVAYLGLGVAQAKSGKVLQAIDSYERARELARNVRQDHPDIHYNLACAYSRRGDKKAALANLKVAVKAGFAEPEKMGTDADLMAIHDDPEFKKLLGQVWTAKDKSRRGEHKL